MSPREGGAERVREAIDGAEEVNPEAPRPLMRDMPPADRFPVDALGDVLAPAAHAIQDRVQAPLAICGQSVLAAATLAVQAHADVELPMRQLRPLTNFYMTIAATGERKSAVDAEALWPARKREAALRERYEAEQRDHRNAKLAWEKARDAAVKSAKGDRARIKAALDGLGPAPPPPLVPLLTCPEPTYEGVIKLFAAGWPSLGIFAAEGGQFIGGHGMSDEAKLRTAAGLSAAWDGEPFKRVRSGEGVTVLPGRRLAMHLMAQPDVASTMLNDPVLAEQGILSRILPTAPEAASGHRPWHEPSDESETAMKRYGARLLDILEHPLPLLAGTQNTLAPRALPLSLEARRLWIGFYDHVERRVGSGGELEPVRGLANKLPEHAARLAAVLTLVRDINAGEIVFAETQAGIDLAQHYAVEALRLFGASRVGEELQLAKQLLDWLRSHWNRLAVSLPDIYQRGPGAIRDKARATRIVIDPRAFLDGGRNASAAAAGEEPSLATLAGLAGRESHPEKPGEHTLFITGALGINARAEGAAAKAAKPAKIETLFELLRPDNDGWAPEDWRARFAERAALAEVHRGLSHAEAELWAFEAVVIEWLNANPSPSPAGRCRWCGKSDTPGAVVLPFGCEPGTHAWLHAECWSAWHRARQDDAIAALRAMGIRA